MDLVASVHKEGSRGGRAEFKWDDVKGSQHRENYLGHSLMAPVGRWQNNKDLSWYSKNDSSAAALSAEEARREEIRRVKEAEQDAMSEALGFGPVVRKKENANETPLGQREVERVVREAQGEGNGDEGDGGGAKGIGFGKSEGVRGMRGGVGEEVMLGEGTEAGTAEERALRRIIEEEKANEEMKRRRRRSGSRDRERWRDGSRERRHRRREDGDGRARRRHHHRHHRSRDRQSRDRSRERSVDRERDPERHRHHHRHRDDKYRERSYDQRGSQERRRSRSGKRERHHDRQR